MLTIGALLDAAAISPRVTARTKRAALAVVAGIAERCFGVKATKVLDAMLEREAISPTGVGKGIAVPHAEIEGLTRMHGIFVRLESPVEFEAVDDEPVDLIFALLAPPDSGVDHLRALARVSRVLRQSDVREQLRIAHSADAIHALLAQEVQISAA